MPGKEVTASAFVHVGANVRAVGTDRRRDVKVRPSLRLAIGTPVSVGRRPRPLNHIGSGRVTCSAQLNDAELGAEPLKTSEEEYEDEGEDFGLTNIPPEDIVPIDDDETTPWATTAARAGDERKAKDVVALRVSHLTFVTTYFVVMSGRNVPQLKAIANLVEERMYKEHGVQPKNKSGLSDSGWILLDYGDMIVHVFSEEQREYYGLEKFWFRAENLDLGNVLQPAEASSPEPFVEDEDDWTI